MSTQLETLLNGVTASGAGTGFDLSAVSGYPHGGHTVQVAGISGDTVKVQGTIDGATWHDIGTAFTSDGATTFGGTWKKIRGNVTIYGSGSITVKIMFGVLDTNVLTRLTAARASLMDNLSRLDAAISTRATSSADSNITNLLKEFRKNNVNVSAV